MKRLHLSHLTTRSSRGNNKQLFSLFGGDRNNNNNNCKITNTTNTTLSSSSSLYYHTNHNRALSTTTTTTSNITPRIKYLHKDYRKSNSINESHNAFDIEYNKIRQSLFNKDQATSIVDQQTAQAGYQTSENVVVTGTTNDHKVVLLSQGYSLGKAYKYEREGDDEKLYGGEDAFFIQDNNVLTFRNNPYGVDYKNSVQAIGVADGVGGWSDIGHDASLISRQLMQNCFFYSLFDGHSFGGNAQKLMEKSFVDIIQKKQVVAGSTTCCVLSLEKDQLHAANIGDSGFLLLRFNPIIKKYELLAKSSPQQHYHNAPYQLSVIPEYLKGKFEDSPSDAICTSHQVQNNDLIVLGTDGLFDNLYEKDIIDFINENITQSEFYLAKQLVLKARNIGFGYEYKNSTPFQDQCEKHGFYYLGGKPDDITVVVARVKHL